MKLKELSKIAFRDACEKGWYDQNDRRPLEIHALIHSEISEATEAVRAEAPHFYRQGAKPEGEAVELADAVIRIADYFGAKGWDLEAIVKAKLEFNRTRPYRHGGKAV